MLNFTTDVFRFTFIKFNLSKTAPVKSFLINMTAFSVWNNSLDEIKRLMAANVCKTHIL